MIMNQNILLKPENIIIPSTGRRAEVLACRHGFDNLDQMQEYIDSLQDGARIMDVGAGMSNLIDELAHKSPDKNFYKFDNNPATAKMWANHENVTPVVGDVFSINDTLGGGFDAIFSYRMAHHFSFEQVCEIVNNLTNLLTDDGELFIGPKMDWRQSTYSGKSIRVDKQRVCDEGVENIAKQISLNKFGLHIQRTVDRTVADYFKTAFFANRDNNDCVTEILNPKTGEMTNKKLGVYAGFAARLATNLVKRNNF